MGCGLHSLARPVDGATSDLDQSRRAGSTPNRFCTCTPSAPCAAANSKSGYTAGFHGLHSSGSRLRCDLGCRADIQGPSARWDGFASVFHGREVSQSAHIWSGAFLFGPPSHLCPGSGTMSDCSRPSDDGWRGRLALACDWPWRPWGEIHFFSGKPVWGNLKCSGVWCIASVPACRATCVWCWNVACKGPVAEPFFSRTRRKGGAVDLVGPAWLASPAVPRCRSRSSGTCTGRVRGFKIREETWMELFNIAMEATAPRSNVAVF
jgi:hypothetical protein